MTEKERIFNLAEESLRLSKEPGMPGLVQCVQLHSCRREVVWEFALPELVDLIGECQAIWVIDTVRRLKWNQGLVAMTMFGNACIGETERLDMYMREFDQAFDEESKFNRKPWYRDDPSDIRKHLAREGVNPKEKVISIAEEILRVVKRDGSPVHVVG